MAIISRSDRQLLGSNNLSFALCSMHILFDSNKFHKFWMSCACRNRLPHDGRNQRKSRLPGTFRADWPDTSTYMGPMLSLEHCDMFMRFQNKANISYPVDGPGRHKVQFKKPTYQCQDRQMGKPPILEEVWSVVLQHRRNRGPKGSGGRPPDLRNQHPRNIPKEPTSRRDQRPSTEGRWPGGTILYRPA